MSVSGHGKVNPPKALRTSVGTLHLRHLVGQQELQPNVAAAQHALVLARLLAHPRDDHLRAVGGEFALLHQRPSVFIDANPDKARMLQ
jgi:hypothetical protein